MKLILVLIMATLLAACEKTPQTASPPTPLVEQSPFVGKWKRAKFPKETLVISKQKNVDFMLVYTMSMGNQQTYPGTLKGGKIVASGGLLEVFLRDDGVLISQGNEYVKD